jgi:PAS domain S-box-containing protein
MTIVKINNEPVTAKKVSIAQSKGKGKHDVQLVKANDDFTLLDDEKEKRVAALRIANYVRSLIEAILDPLFTINTNGKVTDLNNAGIEVVGKAKEWVIGTDFFTYFTDPQKAKYIYEEIFEKGYMVNYPLTIKNDQLTDVLFNGSVYKNKKGIVEGVVVVARDITEQKRIEKELKEAKVFAELATKNAQVDKAKAETATKIAENAMKAKQQFLSNMSHEIRTPMNAIIGFTKVVLKTELTEKQREYLSAIKLSGDALTVLINDILDLAKVESGKMTFEEIPFKLSESIHSMLHLFDLKIREKNLTLLINIDDKIPEVLVGDPMRLHQIILNLMSNAIKFTSKGNIAVDIKLVKENDVMVCVLFTITDTGMGIEEEKIEKIFENFQQAYNESSRLYGGTGLGLAIVKQLIETQGGNINVKSKLNVGTSFSFILPFKKSHFQLQLFPEEFVTDHEFKHLKILVAEDVELNQLLMKALLEDFGFENDIVSNGKLAIEKMENNQYDLILMDLQMPEMNGFETTIHIRKVLKSTIPIIALTADVTTMDVEKCRAIGMDDYISKPIDEKTLYNKILSLLKRAKVETTLEMIKDNLTEQIKYTDLAFLANRTKSNPKLMAEMITLYLQQTPPLIKQVKNSFEQKDWKMLSAAIHKMIPSFSIIGIHKDYELLARKIQEYAETQQFSEEISAMVNQLETTCLQVFKELEKELILLNKK